MHLLRYAFPPIGLIAFHAMAETTTLAVPDQGWAVTFEAPPLRPVREADSNDHYMYSGNANNFAVSLYVDTPACNGDDTHEAALNCFWPKAGKDPLIKPSSVSKSCNQQYCKISYDFENSFQGAPIRQKHIHFLFAYRDRWSNLHAAVSNPTENDLKLLETFASSVSYK
jgi:hypothetical protein